MPEALLREIVPQDYHNAGYLSELLDKPQKEALPEVFKKLANAQSLIGKKSGLPGADATDADWDNFFKTLKPSSTEEYKFGDTSKVDPTFLRVVQDSFLEGTIHPKQAARFMAKYQEGMKGYVEKLNAAKAAEKEKADKAFEELSKVGLGENSKEKIATSRKLLEEHCPAAFKDLVGKLPDKELLIMSAAVYAIAEKFMPEDQLKGKGNTGTGDNGKSKRQEAFEQNKKVSAMTGFEPNYAAERAKLDQLYKEAAAEGSK